MSQEYIIIINVCVCVEEGNKLTKQTNELINTDNSVKWVEEDKMGKRGQIYGDVGRLPYGWCVHKAAQKRCIIEFYTCNLHNVINKCHLNKFN